MIVLVCAVAAVAGIAALTVRKLVHSGDAPRAAAEDYLGDLQRGDTSAAYDMLCRRLRRAMTREQYHELIWPLNAAQPIVTMNASFGFAAPRAKDASVGVEMTTNTGAFGFAAKMRREGGDWRWCGVVSDQFGGSRLDPRQRQ